ncbi:MAG: hypothetical protein ACREP7_15045 [Lysobacter sp.]
MERRNNKLAIAALMGALAVLAVGLGIWWGFGRDRRDDADGARASASATSNATAQAPDSAPAGLPLPKGSFQDVRNELEIRARAGDAQAAYRLGQMIGSCFDYKSIPTGMFTEVLAKAIAHFGGNIRMEGRKLDDPDVLDTMLYAKDEADRICGSVGTFPASVKKGDARIWYEMAAERGHAKAMAEYGNIAFLEFPSDAQLLDHAAEVAARRERARGYLRRAFEAGEPESLLMLAVAHGSQPYLGRDMTDSLAYFKAYRQTPEGRKVPDGPARLLESRLLALVSPQQVRDSAQRSVEILQAFQQRKAPR